MVSNCNNSYRIIAHCNGAVLAHDAENGCMPWVVNKSENGIYCPDNRHYFGDFFHAVENFKEESEK